MSIQEDAIGAQVARAVRERRARLGLTLRALAQRSGVSPSMISDVERQAKSPTVATLAALAAALELPITALVGGTPSPRLHVLRAGAAGDAQRDPLAPTIAGSKVEFLRIVVPPHTELGPFPPHEARTIERIHVAAGRVRITLGDTDATLVAGDGCACVADAPHGFDNRDGTVEALLYLVIERR